MRQPRLLLLLVDNAAFRSFALVASRNTANVFDPANLELNSAEIVHEVPVVAGFLRLIRRDEFAEDKRAELGLSVGKFSRLAS